MSEELACVVISLRDQPGLTRAVLSVYVQEPRPEIVVVNSGSGDSWRTLARAGLQVQVIDRAEHLLPGGARNVGIRATKAPFVSFLAADCIAAPGWVAARLRAHRAGADAVASVITNPYPDIRSAATAHLLLFHRRLRSTPEPERLLYGLSYDRRLFDSHGLFREDLLQGEDTEFRARLREARFVWAPDVQTAHDNPRTPVALLRDQYHRGRRSPAYDGVPAVRLLKILAYARPSCAWRQARRASEPGEREELLQAWPLILPASAAYAAGVLRRSLGREERGGSADLSHALAPYRLEELGADEARG